MKSIRAQLLGWLLPGFVLVFAIAGSGVYFLAKQAIDADLDSRLSRLAGSARLALRNQMVTGGSGTRGPALRGFLAREEFQSPGQYFELWTADGLAERRSLSLGDDDLPRPPELTREGVRYDGVLKNGERVRISAMQFPQGGRNQPLEFAVGISQSDGETRLARLLTDLIMGGLGCCAVLCLLLVLALRFALRPLARVGEQAAAMDASSLHERFAAESMPLEIEPIVSRLNDLMGRLEQGFERERRFSGYLAHELRTPMAAIRSTSEVAAKWPDQSSPEDFHEISLAAASLQQTVDGLLLLARLETSSAVVIPEKVVLCPLIEECLAAYGKRAEERLLKFDFQLERSIQLDTDPRLLRIIVTNLIANATQYAPEGSEIVIFAKDADIFFSVSNLTTNLSPEDMPFLFERLWRKDASRSDFNRSGLGLSVAHSCAVALGFSLTAQLDEKGNLQMSLQR